jgi:hypothetical protein
MCKPTIMGCKESEVCRTEGRCTPGSDVCVK